MSETEKKIKRAAEEILEEDLGAVAGGKVIRMIDSTKKESESDTSEDKDTTKAFNLFSVKKK